jgi:hypothetical protein
MVNEIRRHRLNLMPLSSENADRACLTPRVASRTSAPPFEQRHQKSNMRHSDANLAGLPLVTLAGD